MKQPAVYAFDVDGPIYDGHLIVDFTKYLHSKKRFDPNAYADLRGLMVEYKSGQLPYREAAQQVLERFARGTAGQSEVVLFQMAHQFVRDHSRKFFPLAVRRLHNLKQRSVPVALISLSPDYVVSAMKDALGISFDYYFGSRFQTKQGRFSGKLLTPQVVGFKVHALQRISHASKVPLSDIRFVGDSVTDMESARKARVQFEAQNPSLELAQAIKRLKPRRTEKKAPLTRPVLVRIRKRK